MRTETRHILIEQEVYISDDGKVFKDEDDMKIFIECCKYYGVDYAGVENLGVYMYDGRRWINMSELCDILNNKAKENTND